LNSPTNGTIYTSSSLNPANVQMTASAFGSTPPTSVTFFVDGVSSFVDTAAPFSNTVALAVGSHDIFARAENGSETADSATVTINVRPEFIDFNGGVIFEAFDEIGATGTETPIGWYVGAALPANSVALTAGDGSAGANANVLGWNYGQSGGGDRALGTAPTGADRNIVARIQNNTASSITEINFSYNGEVWRNYTNDVDGWLTNFVSVDGVTWLPTGFDFDQSAAGVARSQPQGAVDGTTFAAFGLGGTFALPTPVPPNGALYIRWQDFNGSGVTDGGLAIDDFVLTATLETFTPTVTITSPTNGDTFPAAAPITITAVPSMANPVTNVTFYDNNLSTVISNDTTSPFSISVKTLSVGNHTLFAVAQDNAGVKATNTATVAITINPNVLPSITITNPIPGSEYLVGSMITNISASASDPDGNIDYVEFYDNGVYRTSDTNAAYGFDLCDVTAGTHVLSAVAIDNAGGRATNSITVTVTNPPGITAIFPNGSSWKYLDNGSDQGSAWHNPGYDDSAWPVGVGEIGYGDAPARPELTTVGFGPNSQSKYPTTYFRKTFSVANPGSIGGLTLRILADDHFIAYLNGTQVFTDMTNAVINFSTLEQPAVAHDGTVYVETNVPVALLQANNVLAIEVHQDSATSSDLSFDAMLWSTGAAVGPRLGISINPNNTVRISWGADAAGHELRSATTVSGPFNTVEQVIGGAGQIDVPNSGNKFYIVR
jgi:hypothetical protein